MKYTIMGFNQEEVCRIGLNLTHLTIIRWLTDFHPKMSKKQIENTEYFWVNYQAILNDLPVLNIKKTMLENRFRELVKLKVLKHKTIRKGGTFSYYSFDDNYYLLLKKNEPYLKNCGGVSQNIVEQNNYSIKNNYSTINKPYKTKKYNILDDFENYLKLLEESNEKEVL